MSGKRVENAKQDVASPMFSAPLFHGDVQPLPYTRVSSLNPMGGVLNLPLAPLCNSPSLRGMCSWQAWVELVDVKQEIGARGLKPVFGPMSTARNKRLLLKGVEDEDKITADMFQVP